MRKTHLEHGMMGVPSGRRGEARGIRGWFLSATPLLILGLAVLVVTLNMRHYPGMCDTDSARDEELKRSAIEKRLRGLEVEIMENRGLVTKIIRGLENAFEVSTFLSVNEVRELARMEAVDIAHRRARKPAPPMSEYARAKVAVAIGGGQLQDLIEEAISAEYATSGFQDAGRAAKGNEGWDWGEAAEYADDFLNVNVVEPIALPKLDVPDEVQNVNKPERTRLCKAWHSEHGVSPGIDWGTLRDEERKKWITYKCDEVIYAAALGESMTVFGAPRRANMDEGDSGEGEELNNEGAPEDDASFLSDSGEASVPSGEHRLRRVRR